MNMNMQLNNIKLQMKNMESQFDNIMMMQNMGMINLKTQIQNMGIQLINMGIQMMNIGISFPSMGMEDFNIKNEIRNLDIQLLNIEKQMNNNNFGMGMNNNFGMGINNNFGMGMNNNFFNVIFKTTQGKKTNLSIGKETTIREMLKQYFREINKPELMNNKYIDFIYNAMKLSSNDQNNVESLFKINIYPQILVNDPRCLIGP